ncbi:MAG: hypothetical protein PW786_05985 [Arachidicoccus sp.]|nr:hypothetical protein [Arachidicoccus sp.]
MEPLEAQEIVAALIAVALLISPIYYRMKTPKTPCDQAKDLAKNISFKSKMNSLKSKTTDTKEHAYSYALNVLGALSVTEQTVEDEVSNVEYIISGPIDTIFSEWAPIGVNANGNAVISNPCNQ